MRTKKDDFEKFEEEFEEAIIIALIGFFILTGIIFVIFYFLFYEDNPKPKIEKPQPKIIKTTETYKTFNDSNVRIILRNNGLRYKINNNFKLKFKKL